MELLVVLAIVAILAAVCVPSISSMLNSYNLNTTGQAVLGQLAFARQSAQAANKAVQVRFYQISDPGNNSATKVYRAVQIFREDVNVSGNTVYTPLARPFLFPVAFACSTLTPGPASANPVNLLATAISGASSNSTGDATNPLPPPAI